MLALNILEKEEFWMCYEIKARPMLDELHCPTKQSQFQRVNIAPFQFRYLF